MGWRDRDTHHFGMFKGLPSFVVGGWGVFVVDIVACACRVMEMMDGVRGVRGLCSAEAL